MNEFKLVKILNKYFNDTLLETLSECANEIMQAGFVQLQADSEGLVKKESRCVKCRAENNGECFDIECTTHSYERGFKDGTVDQKALDDKEKDEAVKKVFKELRGKMWHSETPYCEREYRITVEDYEAILKQTLEELK